MEFADEISQETLRLELDGVHFLSQGSIVGLVQPFGWVNLTCLNDLALNVPVASHWTYACFHPLCLQIK
jgi:hypothetical protein